MTASTPCSSCSGAAGSSTRGFGTGFGVPSTGGWLPAGSNAGSMRIRVPAMSMQDRRVSYEREPHRCQDYCGQSAHSMGTRRPGPSGWWLQAAASRRERPALPGALAGSDCANPTPRSTHAPGRRRVRTAVSIDEHPAGHRAPAEVELAHPRFGQRVRIGLRPDPHDQVVAQHADRHVAGNRGAPPAEHLQLGGVAGAAEQRANAVRQLLVVGYRGPSSGSSVPPPRSANTAAP